jgi:hypothetical protein
MNFLRKAWIEIGIIYADNPCAVVLCPVCKSADLKVSDVRFGNACEYIDRHIMCPKCESGNALRLFRPYHEP